MRHFFKLALITLLAALLLFGCATQEGSEEESAPDLSEQEQSQGEESAGEPDNTPSLDDILNQLALENSIVLGEDDIAELENQAQLEVEAYAEAGYPIEGVFEDAYEYYQQAMIIEKLSDALYGEIVADDEYLQDWYDQRIEAERNAAAESTTTFDSLQSNYERNGGLPPLVVPEGFVHVKHILIEDQQTAEDVRNQLLGGADFDTLLAEHGEDPGMKAEPYLTHGYLVGPESTFVPTFLEASLALEEVGDISELVPSQYGYHIIVLVDKVEPREVPLAEIADYLQEMLTRSLREQELYELVVSRMGM